MQRLVPLLLAASLLLACASERTPAPSEPALVDRKIALGIALLEAGRFRNAQAEFWEIVNPNGGLEPDHCQANYGYALSLAFEFVGALLNAGDWSGRKNGNQIGGKDFLPLGEQTEELDGYLISFIDPALQLLDPLLLTLPKVIAGHCSIEIPHGIQLETAHKTWIRVGPVFGWAAAELALATIQGLHGALDFLMAHDLRVDFVTALDVVDAVRLRGDDLMLRALAKAIDVSPKFLSFHPERKDRLLNARKYLLAALSTGQSALHDFFYESNGPENRRQALGYVDANRNGKVDASDELCIGIMEAHPDLELMGIRFREYPIRTLGPLVFAYVNDRFLAELTRLLGRVAENIEGQGGLLNIAEFNALLPFDLIPNIIAVDLARLIPEDLSLAQPLRRVLPAWGYYDPPGGDTDVLGAGYTTFLFEIELPVGAPLSAYQQEVTTNDANVYCFVCGPGPRFNPAVYGLAAGYFTLATEPATVLGSGDIAGLPDDCVAPEAGSRYSYFWFQDPTFNRALFVNLAGLKNEHRCENDFPYVGSVHRNVPVPRGEGVPASVYSLNKVLNLYLGGTGNLLDRLPF